MRRGHLEFRFVWPLTIIALAAMALLAATLVVGAHVVDLKVRQHEEHVVRRGLDGQLKEVELSLSAQTLWDEAVVRLDNRFDRKWAQQHIAAYLHQSIGTWDYMVVDSDGRPVWANHDVTPMPEGDWAAFRRQAGPIIAKIRKQEQQRGPTVQILQTAAAKIPISKPIVASALELRNGRPYIWIASLVQSDFGAALPRKATSAIVVGGGELTPANIAAFQSRYDLKGVRLGLTPRTRRDGEAFTAFQPLSGPPLALIWTPNSPGADLLAGSIWVIGAVLLCFAALAGLMSRAARRSARALIDVHQAQAEFLANMSHEIRTPLNGVNALSEILAKTPLTAQQKGMVDTIHSSGVMLNRLLSDILDLARIDAGAMGVEAEPFDLGEAVRQVTSLMAPRAQEKGLELRLDLAPAAETSVIGDVTRLRQVLNNLVANAIKFTDAGYVSLTVRPEPGGDWRFEVCDTGIGFSAAQKERIFERFGQADPSVTRRFGGTGLGLSISRELAGKMGGYLGGEGEPGRGAVFTLVIPLPPATGGLEQGAAPDTADPAGTLPPSFRVLVSEDHPANRMVLEILLSQIGAEFHSTEDGQQACEACEVERFDLILMDMQMPVMDGLTAIRQIRRREQERGVPRTPIILVTANAMPEHRNAGVAAGADGFVTKPISVQALLTAMQKLEMAA